MNYQIFSLVIIVSIPFCIEFPNIDDNSIFPTLETNQVDRDREEFKEVDRLFGLNQSIQQTTVTLDATALRQPHILTVATPNVTAELTGDIKLDGKVIQTLNKHSTQINLSPFLAKGRHRVAISGNYYPANSLVKVEFIGLNTQVVQNISGSGQINQILVIDVR